MQVELATLVVTRALVQSYPAWIDEHGTNVEQLAAIAVGALGDAGLLAPLDPVVESPTATIILESQSIAAAEAHRPAGSAQH